MAHAYTAQIIAGDPIEWMGRTWSPVTEAMEADEMFTYLRATTWPCDSETARSMSTGATFDLVSGRTQQFQTMTVASAGAGLVRLYAANDVRDLRNGAPW